jgi:intermediate filament protein if
MRVSQIMKGEMSAKTTYQKSAKGPVAIYECSQDGKYVALENTGRKDELLGSWSLTRNIDGKDTATYKFNDSFVLRPSQKVKVWAKGTRPFTGASGDLESDVNWGVGAHIITKLVNPLGEDRATHIQQTKYA